MDEIIPPLGNTAPIGSAGYQAYQMLCGDVPGTGSISTAQQAVDQLGDQYSDVYSQIQTLNTQLSHAWQGTAADAASSATTPMTDTLTKMQSDLAGHKIALNNQSAGFHTSASAMNPIGPAAPSNNFFNEVTPWHTDLDQQMSDYNGSDAQNQQVLASYQGMSQDNQNDLPQNYQQITTNTTPDTQVTAPAATGGSSAPHYSGHASAANAGSRASSGMAATSRGAGSVGGAPNLGGPGGNGSSGSGGAGGSQGGGSSTTTGQGYINPTPVTGGGNPGSGWNTPGAPGSGSGVGGPNPGGGGLGFAPVGGGFGPTGGGDTYLPGRGYGTGSAGGYGMSNSPGSIAGRGGGAASGIGESENIPAGASAAAAAAERSGTASPGGMNTAAGRRGEDKEHKTAAFLVNEDNGNLIVGDIGPCIPPVIGG